MDELQILRTRCGEMAAEIERLQSVIDEANAWKPSINNIFHNTIPAQQIEVGDGAVDSFEKFAATFDHSSNAWLDMDAQTTFTSGYNRGFLAGRSVEQQSPAVDGECSFGEDNDGWYVENNGEQVCYCASETNARYIAEVMGAKSPVVAVPDDKKLDYWHMKYDELLTKTVTIFDENIVGFLEWYEKNYDAAGGLSADLVAKAWVDARHLMAPSPRITEQDALPDGYKEEWKRNVMLMWSCVRKHDSSIPSDVLDYMRETLLNKLNGDKNGK